MCLESCVQRRNLSAAKSFSLRHYISLTESGHEGTVRCNSLEYQCGYTVCSPTWCQCTRTGLALITISLLNQTCAFVGKFRPQSRCWTFHLRMMNVCRLCCCQHFIFAVNSAKFAPSLHFLVDLFEKSVLFLFLGDNSKKVGHLYFVWLLFNLI